MLNHWTYGWFGQPRSNQTVLESQDPSPPHLETPQTPRIQWQLQEDDAGAAIQGRQLGRGGEGRKVGEDETSPISADSFETALEVNGKVRGYGRQRVRIKEPPRPRRIDAPGRNEIPSFPSNSPNLPHSHSRPPHSTSQEIHDHYRGPPQQSSSVQPTPTISSNTMNRLKAQLSSRSLPPTSPPLQLIPDYPRSQPHENNTHETRRDPYLPQPSSSHFPPHFDQPQFDSTFPHPVTVHRHLHPSHAHSFSERYPPIETEKQHRFFDHQDSPSFPFPPQETGHLPYDFHPYLCERPPSIDSEATLHETSQFSPLRSPRQSISPIPFPDHFPPRPDSERMKFARDKEDEVHGRKMSDWERSVEDEVRKRLELEKRLGGFERGEESLAWARGRRLKDQEEERLKKQEISQSSSRSSKRTSSIGFLPELPPQPEMFLFEGVLLVPQPNFTSLVEISKLDRSHWIPYRAVLTTHTLHFLVQSDPSTQTPILILDFDHCQSLAEPRELRDKEKLFPFMVEMENGKRGYFACESGRDWMTWTNKIRELIDLAHGRAPPTLENVLEFNSKPNNLSTAVLSRPPSSQSTTPTPTSTPRSVRIARHLDELEKNSKALGQNLQGDHNAQNETKTIRQGNTLLRGGRQGGDSREDWMRKCNEDLQVRAFMEEVPDNSRRNDWRFSQPPFPPASPHPQLQHESPNRLRRPRPRSESIGITPQAVDLARSIFEDLSKRNNAIDGRLAETELRAEVIRKRLEKLRDSIGARVGKGEENEIAKDWIDRLEYLSAINDSRLRARHRDAAFDQVRFDLSPSQQEEDALRATQSELYDLLYNRKGNKFDDGEVWSRNDGTMKDLNTERTNLKDRRDTAFPAEMSNLPQLPLEEVVQLFQEQRLHLEDSRRFQQDQSKALASFVRDLHANQKILSNQVPNVQQALSTVKNINTSRLNLAHTGDRAPNRRKAKTRLDLAFPSKILPFDNPRQDYHLIPSDGRMADRAVPPSQVDIWRQGDQQHRGESGKKTRGVRIWGVSNPVPSSYHRSRLEGGLEAARAAKEIAQFETTEQVPAPPPPYIDDTRKRRLSMLCRDQQMNHDDEVLKRELAEELRRDFDEKVDPATRTFAVYEALSRLKEREDEKQRSEKKQ